MQELGVVGRLFPDIVNGSKTSTVRWRERHIEPGLMRYICDDDPRKTATVLVTRCTSMPLSEAASFVGKADVWPDDVMLAGMREHYPDIKLSDVVEVIEHLPPSA